MLRCCVGCILLEIAALLAMALPARAADRELSRIELAGEVPRTTRRLAAADELAAHEKWTEAVDEYYHILTEAGDDLVPLDAHHSLQARRVCHLRLAALPPAALQLYRSWVDNQAKKWLDQGHVARDPAVLRRLVAESFCSRYADQALDLLGDLAFERGGFDEADHWWRMLALPATERENTSHRPAPPHPPSPPLAKGGTAGVRGLLFPDPQVDLAQVRAKQILARLFRGERAGLVEELAAFRTLHPTAKGRLAGQEGLYTEILQNLARQQETLVARATDGAWATLGGNAARGLIMPKPPCHKSPLRPLDGPQWTALLDTASGTAATGAASSGKVRPPFEAARFLAFHPVIDGDRVYVADAHRVRGYNLLDGRLLLGYDLERRGLRFESAAEPDLSYTLTVAGNRIYARLGAQGLGPNPPPPPLAKGGIGGVGTAYAPHAYLVCLDLLDVSGGVERWGPIASEGTAATGPVFEGAPVVGLGRVFLAESRFAAGQTHTAITCYDADTGKHLWKSAVCSVPQEGKTEERLPRYRHHLVTLAGSTVFYCSHSGAIAALDALTGRHLWAVRYPGRIQPTLFGQTPPRDLAPCLYAGGRLYVAPLDSDRVLCLDPDTGRTVWENGPLQVLHLLGVAKGRLIFTTTTPRPCIRAVDAATGRDLRYWMQPADGSELKTFGRGLLAGDWVFWPIRSDRREGLYVLDQETGEPVMFHEKINGNLAVGDGCLAVAGVRELSVYVPEGRLLQRRREEAARSQASLQAQYRLVLAEAGAGLYVEALADLDRLEAQIGPEDRLNGMPLRDLIGRRRQEVLLDAADQAEQSKQWERAAAFLTQAAGEKVPVFARLTALAREATLWTKADQPERAVAVWQSILEDAGLKSGILVNAVSKKGPSPSPQGDGPLFEAEGDPQAAASFASDRIAELIQTKGATVYAAIEQRAGALLASSPLTLPSPPASGGEGRVRGETRRKEVLDRLGREFPNATVTGPALLELATRNEQAGEFGAAARAYRQFLRRAGAAAESPRVLAGLARAYERQSCWSAARATWQQLAAQQGDRMVSAIDRDRPVRAFVAQQLQRREYRYTDRSYRPELFLPLVRAWPSGPVPGEDKNGQRFLRPPGSPWHDVGDGFLFSVRDDTVTCWEGRTGKPCWSRALPQQPRWIGSCADIVLVAAEQSINGLSRSDGERLWSLSLVTDGRIPKLSAFQLAGSRLFFLQDERRLFALDVFTGRVLWTSWAPAGRFQLPSPSGRFHPSFYAGEESVVIQSRMGPWFVLDSRTGRRLREFEHAGPPWPRPPLPLDQQRLAVVSDAEHLTVLDSRTGEAIWTYSAPSPVSLTGEPLQVVGNGDALLILVSRNYAYDLECLDPRTGSRRWSKLLSLGTQPMDLEGGTVDDATVYLMQGNALLAYALADGRLLYSVPLPAIAGHWHVLRTQHGLICFPRDCQATHWQVSWLFATAQLRLSPAPAAEREHSLAVLIYDPRTGRPLQRLNFVAAAHRADWHGCLHPSPVLFPRLSRRLLPLPESEPAVRVSEGGILVQWQEQAWGLRASNPFPLDPFPPLIQE
jgi:outer membrane protein assembly factor BamB